LCLTRFNIVVVSRDRAGMTLLAKLLLRLPQTPTEGLIRHYAVLVLGPGGRGRLTAKAR